MTLAARHAQMHGVTLSICQDVDRGAEAIPAAIGIRLSIWGARARTTVLSRCTADRSGSDPVGQTSLSHPSAYRRQIAFPFPYSAGAACAKGHPHHPAQNCHAKTATRCVPHV